MGCADTRVGSEEFGRGLSGGERRRLAIGEVRLQKFICFRKDLTCCRF